VSCALGQGKVKCAWRATLSILAPWERYKFDENETAIRICFSNKLVRDNTYDFKTWGPKKNNCWWEWEWEWEKQTNFASRTVKFFDKGV
jgi:hypothetical protein